MILKGTKKQAFTLSMEIFFFEKPQGGAGQFDPLSSPSLLRVNLILVSF